MSLRESKLTKRGVMVITSPRSGTHLTIDLMRRNIPLLNSEKPRLAPLDSLYVPVDTFFLDKPWSPARRRAKKSLDRIKYPILKSHWLKPDLAQLRAQESAIADWIDSNVRKVYVSRDVEQTLASMYLFEQGFAGDLSGKDRDEWLIRKSKLWNHHVISWLATPDILHLKFYEILKDPKAAVGKIAIHLDLESSLADPVLPPRINSKWHGRRSRLQKQPPSTEIISSLPRATIDELFSKTAIAMMNELVAPACQLLRQK